MAAEADGRLDAVNAEPAQQPGGRVGDILAQAATQGFPASRRRQDRHRAEGGGLVSK
jgi:hypothetical protein